jgi:hypothetical protein
VQSERINRNNAVFVCELIKPGKALHVVRILIHAVQKDHGRIVVLRIVTPGQTDHEGSVDVVYRNFFLGLLRPELRDDQQHRDTDGGDVSGVCLMSLAAIHR